MTMSVHPTRDVSLDAVSTHVTDLVSAKLERSVKFWIIRLCAFVQQDAIQVCQYASRTEDVPEIKHVSTFNARIHVKEKCVQEIHPVLLKTIKLSANFALLVLKLMLIMDVSKVKKA